MLKACLKELRSCSNNERERERERKREKRCEWRLCVQKVVSISYRTTGCGRIAWDSSRAERVQGYRERERQVHQVGRGHGL